MARKNKELLKNTELLSASMTKEEILNILQTLSVTDLTKLMNIFLNKITTENK